ncbi:extracellular solute-binding protein [Synechococcus sp. CCY9202]|uniref:extracellular solute-binding protein n=1 Tax=Synechococcus sp. CCY9202 TaxID=174698 RepID=UPI003A4C5864
MSRSNQPRRPVSVPVIAGLVALLAVAAGAAVVVRRMGRTPVQELGVYSGRHYNTDKELYRSFTEQTGIRVRLLEGKDDALIERVRTEGANSPADVLVLVDAARLDKAAGMDLFQPVSSKQLDRDVPANLRDPQGRWFALTRRVRMVVVNPAMVDPATIRTYADLAKPALQGKLCLRNNRSVYNQSLVADQLIQRGEPATVSWIKGMVANVSQPFYTSDTPLARAVAKGECGVALVNSYYVGRMLAGLSGEADQSLAKQLKVVFPDPAHVNVSGAGVTRNSTKAEAATRLIEFLASPSGGEGYAEANFEYPLKGYGSSAILKDFGPFRDDGVSVQQMGEKNRKAVELMQANGWS